MQLTAYRTDLTLNDNSVDPRWQQPYFTNLTMRPRIDIVVLHTGTLRFRNNTWPYRYTKYTAVVDTFSISANDPSIYPSQGPRQYTLQGYEASTRCKTAKYAISDSTSTRTTTTTNGAIRRLIINARLIKKR
ncbi:unnamed protein product [Sphagnum balticum]